MDYKSTLNLPNTAFPMRANLAQREPEMLAYWERIALSETLVQQAADPEASTFILHDGPPYANGAIHIGHAVNKVLKDVVMKSRVLEGMPAPFVPGWDCHGLPIELHVEKKLGKVRRDMHLAEFRQACRDYARSQIALQKKAFQRLGVVGTWDNPYLTMNATYEAGVIRALGQIIAKGHLCHGCKPVYWCFCCGSALAEAEVEYQEKTSTAIDVAFFVDSTGDFLQRFGAAVQISLPDTVDILVPIWTTTAWTLPANQAVAVHPDVDYVLVWVPARNRALCIAKALLESVLDRYGIEDYTVCGQVSGKALEHIVLQHPFLDRKVPLVLGAHVTTEAGTGAVHTAPAHGIEDYEVGQQYNLPMDNPVDARACFSPEVPAVGGLHVLKVDEAIVALLLEAGALLHKASIQHSYPHCWRHKQPLIFRATPQWFISMDQNGLRVQALEAIEKVTWVPEWGKARIADMIQKRPDWCISRQRAWGTPMPLFIHRVTNALHPQTLLLIERVAQQVAEKGMDIWEELSLSDLLGDAATEAELADYEKSSDTLDVWFDSGVSHICVLKQHTLLSLPADLYLEGSDQHRGWFQSSLLTSVALSGTAPYQTVLTHGFTVDAQGHKMSKSLGNVVAPDQVVANLGADILRLWVATTDYRGEMHVSDEILQRVTEQYRRIRNTARFLLANLHDFDPAQHKVLPEQLLALDVWVLGRVAVLQETLQAAYHEYHFHRVCHTIQRFCTVELGGFYLDIIKDRQYTLSADAPARRSAQTAIYGVLEALVRWVAPILSFTAEEIWQHMPGERSDSVFLAPPYRAVEGISELGNRLAADEVVMNAVFWERVIAVRDAVNKQLEQTRKRGDIGSALETAVTLYLEEPYYSTLMALANELRFVLITSEATVAMADQRPDMALASELEGCWIVIALTTEEKCVRCWHYVSSVGQDAEHLQICARCVSNIKGASEERLYA